MESALSSVTEVFREPAAGHLELGIDRQRGDPEVCPISRQRAEASRKKPEEDRVNRMSWDAEEHGRPFPNWLG